MNKEDLFKSGSKRKIMYLLILILKFFLRRKLLSRTIGLLSFSLLCKQFNLFTISPEFKNTILSFISDKFLKQLTSTIIDVLFQDTDYLFVGILLFLVIFCLVLEFLKDVDGKIIFNIGVFQNINQTFNEN